MMLVHVLQHVAHEGPGSIAHWCTARGATVTTTSLWEGATLPCVDDFDMLVVLGGPMSVNDEPVFPWLIDEKRLIAHAVASGKAVLGICLGAQLIASALGAKVYPNAEPEIGWHPVRAVSGPATPFQWPRSIMGFHWHGETFDLPPKATLLASTPGCFHQAFCLGNKVIGLQFHPEATPESVAALMAGSSERLPAGPYVQGTQDILSMPAEGYGPANRLLDSVLETIVSANDPTV
jgi:GMP synthase-like glutamine amidotransferase